jgi:A/G-specific adenine glycosylase
MARLFAVETPVPAVRPELRRLAGSLVTDDRPGDWAQALMDLGATVCRPKSPLCGRCPVSAFCAAVKTGDPARYPLRTRKADRPRRHGVAWVMTDAQGRVGLIRRPDKGLLGGMLGLPTSDWSATPADPAPPVAADWREAGSVEHVFTHFALTLNVRAARAATADLIWTDVDDARRALPTVFSKALDRGLA